MDSTRHTLDANDEDTVGTTGPYEDSVEGMLQYHADLSIYYAEQEKEAKTSLKREYYRKKRVKNNQKMYNILVRTPNQYNPLMKYITSNKGETDVEAETGTVTTGFAQQEPVVTAEPASVTVSG